VVLALLMTGLASVELKEEGPVHEKLLPAIVLALSERLLPAHIGLLLVATSVGLGFIWIFCPLVPEVSAGVVDTIRMRYPVPEAVAGNTTCIVPELVEVIEPILTGAVKLPSAFDN
jgi:hypothetical protein